MMPPEAGMPLARTFSPEDVQAERVECVDREVEAGSFFFYPVDHLRRCFIGEGECQDLVWRDVLVYEMEDLLRDDSRFAGAGAGGDELESSGGDAFGPGGLRGIYGRWAEMGDVR